MKSSSHPSPTSEAADYYEKTLTTAPADVEDRQSDVRATRELPLLDFEDDGEQTDVFSMVPIVAEDMGIDPSQVIDTTKTQAAQAVNTNVHDAEWLDDSDLQEVMDSGIPPDCLTRGFEDDK